MELSQQQLRSYFNNPNLAKLSVDFFNINNLEKKISLSSSPCGQNMTIKQPDTHICICYFHEGESKLNYNCVGTLNGKEISLNTMVRRVNDLYQIFRVDQECFWFITKASNHNQSNIQH